MFHYQPPGERPHADLELEAEYVPPEPFWVRFQNALLGLGLAVALLVAVAIIGWLL
jgi:hypothetical protein